MSTIRRNRNKHILITALALITSCSGSIVQEEGWTGPESFSGPYWFLNPSQEIETEEDYQACWDGLPVDRIEFSRTNNGTYGNPVYWAVLSSDGMAQYSGFMLNRLEGDYAGELHLWDYARLCSLVEHFEIGDLEERYRYPTSHAEWVNVKILMKDGSTIKVSDYGKASPPEYQAFCAMIEKVLYEMDWEPTDQPLRD